jgi:hypothetical protein
MLDSNAQTRGRAFGNLAKSFAVPQLFQWLAGKMDQNAKGEPQKRNPQNTWQAIKAGIPGARQTVPAGK